MGAGPSDKSLKHIAGILVDAEHASSEQAAEEAVARGLLDHGVVFISLALSLSRDGGRVSEGIVERVGAAVLRWLNGAEISNRADEPELRARFALEFMRMSPRLARVAANAVLSLPEGHLVRDETRVKAALLEMLRMSGVDRPELAVSPSPDSVSMALDAVAGLVEHRLLPSDDRLALIEKGLQWIDSYGAGVDQRPFRLSATGEFATRAMRARDEGDRIAQCWWLARARSVFQPVLDEATRSGTSDPKDTLLVTFLDVLEREAGAAVDSRASPSAEPDAAASHRSAVDVSALRRDEMPIAAMTADLESRAAYDQADYERVVRMLSPYISWFEERYITAVAAEHIASAGESFSKVMTRLAFAQAHRGKWDSAIRLLEGMKSKRFRYQAALRRGSGRDRVIALEEVLRSRAWEAYALAGSAEVSPESVERTIESRVLEDYRRLRESSPAVLANLRVRDLSRHLAAGDALLILGMSHLGILMALIRRGDRAKPSRVWTLPSTAWEEIIETMGNAERGWIVALESPSPGGDVRTVLPTLLSCIDAVLGVHLAPCLEQLNVRRLTVVPHGPLHFVPFWTLPSLDGVQVDVMPSAAHFVDACAPVRFQPRGAVVVSNPTLDLPLAELEGEFVADCLGEVALGVEHIRGRRATRQAMEAIQISPAILHFAGHGRGNALRPLESALELHPGESKAEWQDHLLLTRGNPEWSPPYGGERSVEIPGVGRLTEVASPGTCRVERRLVRSGSKTLAALFRYVDEGKRAPDPDGARRRPEMRRDDAHDWPPPDHPATPAQVAILEAGLPVRRRWEAMEQTLARGDAFRVELIRVAELWTAGDILSSRFLSDCGIAFLSTCETAVGQLGTGADESAGFSAALQLAGVSAVISPMWPVDTVVATVFAELFYEELTTRMSGKGAGGHVIDLGRIAHQARTTMRWMRNDEAVARLQRGASRCGDPMTALLLEAEATRMSRKGARPFEHPMDWGAFHALGAKRLVRRTTLLERLSGGIKNLFGRGAP